MFVYWVHNIEETDVWSQGYVGITKNPESRKKQHKKLNRTEFTILAEGEKLQCRQIEYKLRPTSGIGLNKNPGGGYHSGYWLGKISWKKGITKKEYPNFSNAGSKKGSKKPKTLEHQLNNSNSRARNWLVVYPNGDEIKIHNLATFCKKHNIHQSNICKRNGTKGYRAYHI